MGIVKWNKVYHQLAIAIAKVRDEKGKKAGAEIYGRLNRDTKFLTNNQWFAKYSSLKDQLIDPVVLFASLNSSLSKRENRLIRVNHLARIFMDGHEYDDIDFTGCPTPISINLMSVRNKSSQENLWAIFENAMRLGVSFLNQDVFDSLKYIRGLDIAAFTIFLFWIDSEKFLPLDKHTVGYLLKSEKLKRIPTTYSEYHDIMLNPGSSFLEISEQAYALSQYPGDNSTVSSDKTELKDTNRAIGTFRLLGIKPLDGLKKNCIKVLEPNKIYAFYKSFDLQNFSDVRYFKELDLHLYSTKEMKVSISSIVGKNGTGKSTITELIYMAINLLAQAHQQISTELEKESSFNFELFYVADFLYCIRYIDSIITIFKYQTREMNFVNPLQVPLNEFDLNQFFYTIAINYSLYGLNSRQVGRWIKSVFVKNDGYQVPIVINPYREYGNINVNTEQILTRQRLMVNLLLPFSEEEGQFDLRKVTDKASAVSFTVKLNREKFTVLYTIKPNDNPYSHKPFPFEAAESYYYGLLEYVCEKFNLDKKLIPAHILQRDSLIDYAFWYILQKLINISRSYSYGYFDIQSSFFTDYKGFIDLLSENYSHITNKLRQAINFIKYDEIRKLLLLSELNSSTPTSIGELSALIEKTISDSEDSRLTTIQMIPPSFLVPTILLDDDSMLDDLSSGEKQRIYAINSLIYHLNNLNSVSVDDELVSYRYVNIIFDEIELYFHPEMQKDFVNYLLLYLERINLDRIAAVNILIITHSPFILSDIPSSNILFLGETDEHIRTFGSNIHDLLANSFFMKAFMGNYVKKVIGDLANYLDPLEKDPNEWSQERAADIIEQVGEPLIRKRLTDMYITKFKKELDRKSRISELEQELFNLKNETNT